MSNLSAPQEFDQVVEGNIDIKQLSKNKYKITFSKISKFLLYQVWSDSSNSLNENRKAYYLKAKNWVQDFIGFNEILFKFKNPLLNPTTVMEFGNNKYVFVLNQAKLNGKGHIVFKVSTKEIKLHSNISKKILRLPEGYFKNARFDIDSYDQYSVCSSCRRLTPGCAFCCSNSNPPSFCPGPSPPPTWYILSTPDMYLSLDIYQNSKIVTILGFPLGNSFWTNVTGDWYTVMATSNHYAAAYSTSINIGYCLVNCTALQLVYFSNFATLTQSNSSLANTITNATVKNEAGDTVSANTLFMTFGR